MEITDATTVTLSVGGLLSIASVITAWANLRSTVAAHAEQFKSLHEQLKEKDRRIGSLERWRERIRGAESFSRTIRRDDTDRILLPAVHGGSAPHEGDR